VTQTAIRQTDLVFAVEPFRQAYAEAGDLLRLHWTEIAKNKQLLVLSPDEEFYDLADRRKTILIVTARHEGRLVGYFLWYMLPRHPHYREVAVAEAGIHFLLPEHRRGLNGYKLIKAACGFARAAGAHFLTIRYKLDHDHPELMTRLGFSRTDVTYTMAG
jgi:GNAT superfamily N-acetyltransferase